VFTPEYDLNAPAGGDTVLVIADANATGLALKAVLAKVPNDEVVVAIKIDDDAPILAGVAPEPWSTTTDSRARVGLQLSGSELRTCSTTDKAASPATDAAVKAAAKACNAAGCASTWIGIGDHDRADALLPAIAIAYRGTGGATLGAHPCQD